MNMCDPATAAALLAAAAEGWGAGDLGPLGGQPALVVDLDQAGWPGDDVERGPLPLMVIGVSRSPAPPAAPAACDIVLSAATAPPRPWVGCGGDPHDTAARLVARVEQWPAASCTLSQLLRMGERLDVDGALVAESLAYSTLQGGPEFARWLAGRDRRPPAPATGPPVLVERDGERLTVTFNRPGRRNAYSAAVRDALVEALGLALSDPSVVEVVISGAGPAFCSGGDLDEFGTLPDPATAQLIRTTRSAGALIARLGQRAVVCLHGACVGAGIELPAFAGRVVAAPGTRMSLPEVGMGLVPGAGGTASIPRRIGRQRTAWLALSGEWLDAPTAAAWGLVDELAG